MMKKAVFLLVFTFVLSCAFALDESVEAFVRLPVPTNSIEIGFSSTISSADSGITSSVFKMKAPTIDKEIKMKKTIIVLFLFLVGLNLVFGADAGLAENDNQSTNLTLNLDGDAYLVGFSKTKDNLTHQVSIDLSESIDENAMTVKLVDKEFYSFYKAITDDADVKFKIAVTPLYLGGTEVPDDDSKKIDYTATITKTNKWDGESFESFPLNASDISNTSDIIVSDDYNLKSDNHTIYLATGIASVDISSNANLGEKVPGRYSGTIKVTLQSGS